MAVNTNGPTTLTHGTAFLKTPVVTVLVGSNGGYQQSFAVHEGLLKGRSECFTNALKPERFKEGVERMIPMPEEEPDIFAIYVQFLYHPDLMSDNKNPVGEGLEQEYICLAKLYVLVEKFIDIKTKDHVFHILKFLTEIPFISLRTMRIIYDGTPYKDPARALVVDWFTRHDQGVWFERLHDDEHVDLFRDLAFAFGTRRALHSAYVKVTDEAKNFKEERDDLKGKVEDKDKNIWELGKVVKDLKVPDEKNKKK